MKSILKPSHALFIAGLISSSAMAGGVSPLYIGAQGGAALSHASSIFSDYCKKGDKNKCVSNKDPVNFGGGAHLGFQFHENFGVELGYTHLAQTADLTRNLTNNGTLTKTAIEQNSHIGSLSGIGRYQLSKETPISVYGKGGVSYWYSKLNETSTTGTTKKTASVSEGGVGGLIGTGLEYSLNPSVNFRAGWERHFVTGKGKKGHQVLDSKGNVTLKNNAPVLQTINPAVDVFSVGVNYHFM